MTVYVGGRKGNASSGDFSPDAVNAAVDKALTIAKYTSPDPFAGLADASLMAKTFPTLTSITRGRSMPMRRLRLPSAVRMPALLSMSASTTARASVSASESEFVYANSHGFAAATRAAPLHRLRNGCHRWRQHGARRLVHLASRACSA